MTFLVPGALLGLALLAIPVVVHLFKPRRVRQTPFSSLRWLHLTQQRMARRIQWHQVLLFLLRAAFLTLLVLALARPLYAPKGTAGARDRIVVVDVSRSMGRRLEGRPRPIDTARRMAADTLHSLQAGDRAAVLLTGPTTTILAPWSTDAAPYLARLESLEPGAGATHLDSSLDSLRALIELRRPNAAVDVTFLTDNTSGSWTSGAIAEFVADCRGPRGIGFQPVGDHDGHSDENSDKAGHDRLEAYPTVRMIDVSLPAPRNGWLSAARLRQTEAGPALHVEATCVGDAAQSRTLTVDGLAGVEPLTTSLTLDPGRVTAIDLPLPATFVPRDSRARLRLDPPDELPDDDEFFVDLDAAGSLRLLFIEPDSPAEESQRAGFPLRTALRALGEAGAASGDADIVVRSPSAVTTAEIGAADVIILADVPGLTSVLAEALTQRVQKGAGVAIFLGPRVEAENYNQRFLQPLRPAEGLLPAALGSTMQTPAAQGGLAAWGRWDAKHPLTTGLLDPLLGDLAQTRSRAWLSFTAAWPATDEVVAKFDDGTAALGARRVGAGRVVVVNGSPDDRWCDLPHRKSFVPVVDRLITFLASAGRNRTFAAGEAVTLALPAGFGSSAVVRTPSGRPLTPRLEQTETGIVLRLEGLEEAGFYEVVPAAGAHRLGTSEAIEPSPSELRVLTFVVQPSREESPLAAMDPETLRSWWSPVSLEVVKPSAATAAVGTTSDGRRALDPVFLLLAGGVLLAEMFLVHWLCPKMNPALAASGRRKGFVAPLRVREAQRQVGDEWHQSRSVEGPGPA